MSKQQTAVEWFMDKIKDLCEFYPEDVERVFLAFDLAKQMEKDQLFDFYLTGQITSLAFVKGAIKQPKKPDDYYSETYGGDHE